MEELHYISPSEIIPNPYQPRQQFDQEKLTELAQSIQQNGLIQPIVVRKSAVVGYELLAGERRLRACQLAGLETIPAIVKELTDDELMYQSIIENLQRADLNPIEEAKAYQHLLEKGLTHEEIACRMGKSRPYITNIIRLLQLTAPLQTAVETGVLSQGHARLLVTLSAEEQEKWLQLVLDKQLSVRQLEQALAAAKKENSIAPKNLFLAAAEEELHQQLGTEVRIQQQGSGRGTIRISFDNTEELDRLINNLKS